MTKERLIEIMKGGLIEKPKFPMAFQQIARAILAKLKGGDG